MKQIGLVKEQFQATFQRSPWNQHFNFSFFHQWPLLEAHLECKRISYADYLLTHRLLRDFPSNESVAFFVCHLLMAGKAGHLCIEISNNQIFPPVYQLWNNENSFSLSQDETDRLNHLIIEGSQRLPTSLMTQVENIHSHFFPQTPICQYLQCFYLQKYWIYESHFLEHFNKHLTTIPSIEINLMDMQHDVDRMLKNGEINFEQAQAIQKSCMHPITLITGGPGTGKSYTAGKLIHCLIKNLKLTNSAKFELVLAAPTGKAAANLQKSLKKEGASEFSDVQAKTLHSLLHIHRSSTTTNLVLNADLIVIDECSMIDLPLMSRLFESLKPGCRVILLGDPHQLPPVGAGSVFTDLCHLHQPQLPISHTHLKTCLRAELKSIIDFAEVVKNGNAEHVIEMLTQSKEGLKRLKLNNSQAIAQKELTTYLIPYFPSFVETNVNYFGLFQAFNKIRLLSTLRKGFFGVDTLNQLIWKMISQKKTALPWLAVPIMINTNNSQLELYNGDTGILFRKLPLHKMNNEDFALFPCRTNEKEFRRFSAALLPKYDLAYCLSVHKSQGSEFEHVILTLPEGSELFGRKILYTAITRARKKIEIWGSDSTLRKTIINQEFRFSNVVKRFHARINTICQK